MEYKRQIQELIESDDPANWSLALITLKELKEDPEDAENTVFIYLSEYYKNGMNSKLYEELNKFILEDFESTKLQHALDWAFRETPRPNWKSGGIQMADITRTGEIKLSFDD